jgi:hypothetical protein
LTQFQDLPVDKTFGHGFNYAVWSGNTTVSLHKVTWDSSYKDVYRPASVAAFETYLANNTGPVITTNTTYAALGRPVRLQIPFEQANTYNYLRAYNPAQPISGGDTGRAYYYFVSSVNYIAPDTTEFILQLDVWATYWNTTVFGRCFIERSHAGIANTNRMNDYGREYLTVPEGFDLGGEYQIVDQWKRSIANARNFEFSIMVTSTVSLTADPGTMDDPKLTSARGSNFENLPNGASLYLFDSLLAFKDFLSLYADKPWITQGIINIMAIPDNDDYGMSYDETTITVGSFSVVIKELKGGMFNRHFVAMKSDWRDSLPLPSRYAHLDKFKVHPYTSLEMSANTGTPIAIKPESWANPHAIVQEMPHFAPPGARLQFVPYRYNAAGPYDPAMADLTDDNGDPHDDGEFLDFSTGIYNFPTFSLVNNGYMTFLAANQNSIAFQHSSADWSQQRALTGADVAANQAGANIDASRSINALGMTAAGQSTTLANETAGWQALQAAGNSVIGGIEKGANGGVAGGVVSAVKGGANAAADYAIGLNQRNRQLGITTGLMGATNTRQNQAAEYTRDTNLDYAQYAAKGDYSNAIAGINAKVQDARMIQPTTSGQVGGEAFNLATYKWGYDIKVKMLQGAAMAAIGEYWLRYGYAVNRYGQLPADLAVMSHFTYWKLKESYIVSAECPEVYKNTMRGIFEKGVTVWKNPADIGNIDTAVNTPLAGVTL